jgi:hypothetical protein
MTRKIHRRAPPRKPVNARRHPSFQIALYTHNPRKTYFPFIADLDE